MRPERVSNQAAVIEISAQEVSKIVGALVAQGETELVSDFEKLQSQMGATGEILGSVATNAEGARIDGIIGDQTVLSELGEATGLTDKNHPKTVERRRARRRFLENADRAAQIEAIARLTLRLSGDNSSRR